LWVFVVLFVSIAALFAMNAHDEGLSEEAKALLKVPDASLAQDQNLYFALRGR
jgi:hypothetical protein